MIVLVAVDLSAGSGKVVDAAVRIAGPEGRLVVVHTAEPEPDFVGYDAEPNILRDQMAAEFHREHREIQAIADQLRGRGIDATALLIQGPMVEKVLKEAKHLGADLIVVGSHGHGAVYDLVVGSYSAEMLRHSPIPVLVVPVRDA